MIFGVAGPNGAGKGEIVDYLKARSFSSFSLSDVIRQELARRGLEETRARMIDVGRELREAGGPGVLAAAGGQEPEAPTRTTPSTPSATPPRSRSSATSGYPFKLIWVDADIQTRLERLNRRGRKGDPQTLEELRRSRPASSAATILPPSSSTPSRPWPTSR